MTHLGSGLCIAAAEMMMIFVRQRGAMLISNATSQDQIGSRSSVSAADMPYAAARYNDDSVTTAS